MPPKAIGKRAASPEPTSPLSKKAKSKTGEELFLEKFSTTYQKIAGRIREVLPGPDSSYQLKARDNDEFYLPLGEELKLTFNVKALQPEEIKLLGETEVNRLGSTTIKTTNIAFQVLNKGKTGYTLSFLNNCLAGTYKLPIGSLSVKLTHIDIHSPNDDITVHLKTQIPVIGEKDIAFKLEGAKKLALFEDTLVKWNA